MKEFASPVYVRKGVKTAMIASADDERKTSEAEAISVEEGADAVIKGLENEKF